LPNPNPSRRQALTLATTKPWMLPSPNPSRRQTLTLAATKP